ncbi:MAG: hypothetical protein KGI89_16665, partial [Euryarchaeota archaeon]|nr:hypothetical protein [Euryarchaeota archaeon]
MRPEQLWVATTSSEARAMLKVNVQLSAKANDLFVVLMGGGGRASPQVDPGPRRRGHEPRRVTWRPHGTRRALPPEKRP